MPKIRPGALTPAGQKLASLMKRQRRVRGNRKPDIEGRMHPTESEADWFSALILRERRGEISELERSEPAFPIDIAPPCPCDHCVAWRAAHAVRVGVVKADARYRDADGRVRIADHKGWAGDTPLSRFKRRVAMALHGIDIELEGEHIDRQRAKKAKRAQTRALMKMAAKPK